MNWNLHFGVGLNDWSVTTVGVRGSECPKDIYPLTQHGRFENLKPSVSIRGEYVSTGIFEHEMTLVVG